jgi:hypothetical protein
MRKVRSIDLGPTKFSDNPTARAIADDLVQGGASPRDVGAFMGFLDNLGPQGGQSTKARSLKDFTSKQIKDELLSRGVTDFSRITPWIRNALWLVIAAAMLMGYWGMKCQDGELFGFVCSIAQ